MGLRRQGFEVTRLAGVAYDPLRGEWGLTDDLSANYLLMAKRGAEPTRPG